MIEPENRVATNAGAALHELRVDLQAFEDEMKAAGVPPTLRARLRTWWEERIGGRVLDRGERALRGIRREN